MRDTQDRPQETGSMTTRKAFATAEHQIKRAILSAYQHGRNGTTSPSECELIADDLSVRLAALVDDATRPTVTSETGSLDEALVARLQTEMQVWRNSSFSDGDEAWTLAELLREATDALARLRAQPEQLSKLADRLEAETRGHINGAIIRPLVREAIAVLRGLRAQPEEAQNKAIAMLVELHEKISSGRLCSIGSIDNVLEVRFDREQMARLGVEIARLRATVPEPQADKLRDFRNVLEAQRSKSFEVDGTHYTPYRHMLAEFYRFWPDLLDGRTSWNEPLAVPEPQEETLNG